MLHAPEWIPAWRLKQAYALTEADIVSLVEELGEKGHVSLHAAWDVLQEYFLQPQTKAMPEHWRSIFDDLPVKKDSPSWIVRAFRERDSLYEALRIVSVHADSEKLQGAITTLFKNIYEGEPSAVSVEAFCTPFVIPDNQESSRLFFQIFYESLLFNKYTAVETLERARYPLIAEVKGITKDFVKVIHSKIQQPVGIPIEESESVDSQDCVSQLIPVNVPASLWAGKTLSAAHDALKKDFAPEVIAVILGKLSDNKTECGRCLAQDEISKGVERDAGTYQRRFDNSISQANQKYLLTFNE